jgi:hypothetical protein
MDTSSVIEARKKAEHAVADMPEGDLKVKAFEVILNRLLSAGEDASSAAGLTPSKRHAGSEAVGRHPELGHQTDAEPSSAPARVLHLKVEGFFGNQRGIGEIRRELQTHGWRYPLTALSGTLMKLVRTRELRRELVNDGHKTVYKYFNP